MAAWTYPEDNPATHTLFGQKDISPDHCYSILGIYACQNGKNYVILRDTNGLHDPAINVNICTVPDAYKFWRYSDVLFKVGPLTAFTLNPAHILKQFDLSVNSDAVFGLEIGDFKKYFSHFGWVKGY